MKRSITALAAGAGLAALALAGCGDTGDSASGSYQPRGDVTMIIPFAPGGGSDLAGRATAAAIEDAVDGVNVSVENRDGGSGAVGYSYFLGQAGDAETLLATETALLALPNTQEVEFDYEDFTPIAKLADDYTLMVTSADAPYEDCKDVVAASKSDRMLAGISGQAGVDNIVLTLTEQQTGAEFDRVVFESGGELTAALLGGQVDIASLNPGEVMGQLESGDLKALCAYSEQRYDYEELKDIPTAKEQGIDVAFAQFRGVLAPGGISEAQKEYWTDVMGDVMETDAYQEWVESGLLQDTSLVGDEFSEYLDQSNETVQQAMEG